MKKPLRVLARTEIPENLLVALGIGYVVLVGILDLAMPPGMHFTLLYFIGIAFVAWRTRATVPIVLGLASAIFSAVHSIEPRFGEARELAILFWDIGTQAVAFCALALLVTRVASLTRHLGNLVEQRKSQYETILATAMDGFAVVDQTGKILDVNQAYCQLVGWQREELIGTNVTDIDAKEDPAEFQRHIARFRERGCYRFETRHKCKNGGEIDLEVSASLLVGEKGLMVAFARDISGRKKDEATLRDSEARYRTLAESSPDAILVLNDQLDVQYANSAAGKLWHRLPERLIGVAHSELFDPINARKHFDMASGLLHTGNPFTFDERITAPGGERWIETRFVPVPQGEGKSRNIIATCVDITERKRTELLLQAQKDLGNRLSRTSDLKHALEALLEIVRRFEAVDIAGVYLRDPISLGLRLEAHSGELPAEFLSQVSYIPPESDRAGLVAKGVPFYGSYGAAPLQHGENDPFMNGIAVIPMVHEGAPIGSLNLGSRSSETFPPLSRIGMEVLAAQAAGAIVRIRTAQDRQRLQAQILEITDRQQARIGQEIHDGLCQQLVSLAFDANRLHQDLVKRRRGESALAERIAGTLDDAITEARQLARGLFPIRMEGAGLVSALEELARTTCTRLGIHCEVEATPAVVVKETVAIHLFRIAQEAVTNAVKHGQAKEISIRLHSSQAGIELQVQDKGTGMGLARSNGMGLHIMDYRARSIGGELRVTQGSGTGTTISCCVPLAAEEKMGL